MSVDLSRLWDCVWNQLTGKTISRRARYSTLKLFLAGALNEHPHKLGPVRLIGRKRVDLNFSKPLY
jgi:hypothetical protein